jgi:hypothetical protein
MHSVITDWEEPRSFGLLQAWLQGILEDYASVFCSQRSLFLTHHSGHRGSAFDNGIARSTPYNSVPYSCCAHSCVFVLGHIIPADNVGFKAAQTRSPWGL